MVRASWPRPAAPERAVLWVAAVLALLAMLHGPTSASMVVVWQNSTTFSHGFLVVPAFLVLVWTQRHTLAALPWRPSPWALPALLLAGLAWWLGQTLALSLPSQLALVAMLPAVLAGWFGLAWVRTLQFPLAFLFFAVPAGDSLVPVLMDWTADFAVAALRLSGVPVWREGLHFEIPSGRWSVVDSCSGIRYLFACAALASLYGWLSFRSNLRRWAFLGLALLVAIVANWLRAYAIVMLGHLTDNRLAAGADHLVYGAVFFVVVMATVFALGAAWRETQPTDAAPGTPPAAATQPVGRAGAVVALATGTLLFVGPLLGQEEARPPESAGVATLELAAPAGWDRVAAPSIDWRPVLVHPAARGSATFARDTSVVGVHLGLFGRPTPQSKLTAATNRLLAADGQDPNWKLLQQGRTVVQRDRAVVPVNSAVLLGPQTRLRVWQWYWVDDSFTGQPWQAVWLQWRQRLRGEPEQGGWVSLYTSDTDDVNAERTLQAFVNALPARLSGLVGTDPK